MMHRYILGIRDQHLVVDETRLLAKLDQQVAKSQRLGARIQVHPEGEEIVAYCNHGCWVADCPCGGGVAVEPEFDKAACFGCGAVYSSIRFPRHRDQIEAELLKRPKRANRNWTPDESPDDLRSQNAARGIE